MNLAREALGLVSWQRRPSSPTAMLWQEAGRRTLETLEITPLEEADIKKPWLVLPQDMTAQEKTLCGQILTSIGIAEDTLTTFTEHHQEGQNFLKLFQKFSPAFIFIISESIAYKIKQEGNIFFGYYQRRPLLCLGSLSQIKKCPHTAKMFWYYLQRLV